MKKLILLVTACVMLILSSIPFAFAVDSPSQIISPMEEPQASSVVNGNVVNLVYYVVYNQVNYDVLRDYNPLMIEYTCQYPVGSNVVLRFAGQNFGSFVCDSTDCVVSTRLFDVSSGNFIGSRSPSRSGPWNWGNPYPSNLYFWLGLAAYTPNMHTPYFYIVPDGYTVTNDEYYVSPWVTWSEPEIPVNIYRSFCSRPVADEYNRYMILAGEDQQYLYAIRYFVSETVSVSESIQLEQETRELICPYLDVNNNGLQFRLSVPEDLIYLIGQNTFVVEYDLQIAVYNLSDGQYIASYVFTDYLAVNDVIDLSIIYPDLDDITSVDFYGVMYQNTSTRYKWNLLTCVWSVDPSFETWKSSVENYLRLIYENLSQTGEDVTIAQDPSAYDEMQSAADDLKVTDPNGQDVDPAEQVEVAFSEAASGIGSIGGGISSVNGMMADLFQVNPIVIVPLVVALALGLIVTILGKDKSD